MTPAIVAVLEALAVRLGCNTEHAESVVRQALEEHRLQLITHATALSIVDRIVALSGATRIVVERPRS